MNAHTYICQAKAWLLLHTQWGVFKKENQGQRVCQNHQHHHQLLWLSRWTHRIHHIVLFQARIYYSDTHHRQQRERRRGRTTSGGSQAHASQGTFPVQSHRTRLIAPAASYSNTCEALSTREAPLGQGGQRFYRGAVTETPSLWHIPKFQTPRGKQGLSSINHIFYTNSWRAVSRSCQLGNSGDLLEVRLRASLASSFKPARYSFCTRDLSICWCCGLLPSVCVSSLYIYTHMYPIYMHPVCIYTHTHMFVCRLSQVCCILFW